MFAGQCLGSTGSCNVRQTADPEPPLRYQHDRGAVSLSTIEIASHSQDSRCKRIALSAPILQLDHGFSVLCCARTERVDRVAPIVGAGPRAERIIRARNAKALLEAAAVGRIVRKDIRRPAAHQPK